MPQDIFLATAIPPALEIALAECFTLHRDTPPPTTRAIVGGGMMTVDAALLDRLPELQIIAVHGVGFDGIDRDATAARGIRIAITPDALTDDVADQAIALWLAVDRRIAANDRALRMGNWTVPLGRRASGRRIGIFGLGRIGQAIAKRAAPFAGEILYTTRSEKPVAWRFVPDLPQLAEESDVLILAAPGGAETRGVVDAEVLDRLGADGVLVNIARGSLVDEDALIAALEAHRIAGAGLDVFVDEPEVPYALRRMNHVVLAPHQGSATREGRAAMAEMVVANLEAHFAGREVPGLLG
ncbi:2-hydroxyacid dehydrogenase [Sphingomonas sp. SORGH_AS_0879]|uniref:2-hydroxyacid dehydrogenase n=1 Tax=Sphingomonas sp. SORGH_AS_0879 TaxID=3041790 RepID=UPI002785D8BE|nr:2-hydroxyacid dehydrogenase [Sphingomonas sp. SORGH_AS_0879]MDQ1232190.1 lactate dehydrogenase-like 2-hydroxyacid dehydrogenase [Sphingomonas sp. SORGH_AS_0879]